jgi:PKD domain/Gametolysin peptidase M11
MKSLSTVRRSAFALVWLIALATGPASWAADDDRARRDVAFRSFDEWLESAGLGAASGAMAPDDAATATEEAVALARERRRAMLELARTDPREALARALPLSTIQRLPAAVRALSEEYIDACGAGYGVTIGDDFSQPEAPVSRVTRTLTVGDRTYEARVFGRRLGTPSKSIHANGIAIDGLVVLQESPLRRLDPEEASADPTARGSCAEGRTCIAVKVGAQTLVFASEAALKRHQAALEQDEATLGLQHPAGRAEALAPVTDPGVKSAWTTGQKTLLYIRADFSDRPGDPVAAATVQTTMDDAVDGYFHDNSYQKTSLVTTVTPTVRLPRTAADYEANGDGPILADARAAARAIGFDAANFNLYIVAFPRLSFGYSGKAYVGGPGVWLNGSFGSGVTAHELGHNYGVHHANLWQTTDGSVIGPGANVEYGNVFDVMGRGGVRGHFNAWFKTRFDWLLPGEYTNVTASGAFTIEPIDDSAAAGQRALKIVKDSTRNYWVEFRQLFTTNRWAMNGALLNWGYNSNKGSHLLDNTPGSSNQQNDAALLVGRTFSDTVNGIHITPVARRASPPSMDVVVKLGTFPGNSPPVASLSASALTVARNIPVTITTTASDANGDALAYGWEFDDGTLAPNLAAVTRSWTTDGTKVVRCVVSDMVGGTTAASISITVSSVATFTISGTVTTGGQPLAGVVVSDGTRSATTSASGAYTIGGVPNGTYTLTPSRAGYTFSPASLSVTVNGANLTGRNFTATPLPANLILEARFDSNTNGFVYLDDAFRGTAQPAYASGARVASGGLSGGALRVAVGGVDDADIVGMSGGWRVTFNLAQAQPVRLSFAYKLTQTANYESDERSEMLATLDGTLLGTGGVIAQIVGNGNGGSPRTTGFQTFQADLGTLAAGTHTLAIGSYNSKKTLADESTEGLVDDVLVFRP